MTEASSKYEPLYGKVLLGDGDILAHRAAAVAERKHYLVLLDDQGSSTRTYFESGVEAKQFAKQTGGHVWTRQDDLGEEFSFEALRASVNSIIDKTKPKNIELFLSGPKNFRKDLDPNYKGSRVYQPKPKYLKKCREYLKEEYGAAESGIGEADDGIGIRSGELGEESVICTIDKDLNQLSGWHYNWVDDYVFYVTTKEASYAFYNQVLSGDRTDDVEGIPGIGPAKACGILEGSKSVRDLFERVWSVYRDRSGKGTPDEAWDYLVTRCELLYILRGPSDHWKPPFIPEEIRWNGRDSLYTP